MTIYYVSKSNMDKVQGTVRLWKGFETRTDVAEIYMNQ